MKTTLNKIMLVDDNNDDNFFHEREIKKVLPSTSVITKNSGIDALDYLKAMNVNTDGPPVLIFLDINMPLMDGWEFLTEYQRLEGNVKNCIIIIMLSTSENTFDISKAKSFKAVTDYIVKPLSREIMTGLISKYFYFDSDENIWLLKDQPFT